jgi:hypothetical protein
MDLMVGVLGFAFHLGQGVFLSLQYFVWLWVTPSLLAIKYGALSVGMKPSGSEDEKLPQLNLIL